MHLNRQPLIFGVERGNRYTFTARLLKTELVYLCVFRFYGILFSLVGINTKLISKWLLYKTYTCSLFNFAWCPQKAIAFEPLQSGESCFNWPGLPLPLRERRSMVDYFSLNRHCWPHWVLEHPQHKGFIRMCCFHGAVVVWLGSTTHTVATALVVAIAIAVDDGDGGAKDIID